MIIFSNEGLVPIEAFTTFGINAKPNTDNPIGYFGTGLKYAVAVTLRLGGTFTLFRGTEQYVFYTKEMDFRGKDFTTIRMKKRNSIFGKWNYSSLPFTTELGKNWQPWQAVRELESNTRDEGGWSCLFHEHDDPVDNRTMIIIECEEMEAAYSDLHNIFLDVDGKTLLAVIGDVEIYDAPSDYIFFRGLRVTDLRTPSMFTYNFKDGITLTEDRTSMYSYSDQTAITTALMASDNEQIVERITSITDTTEAWEASLSFDQSYTRPSPLFIASVGARISSGSGVSSRLNKFYRDTMGEPDEEELHSVSLTLSQWRKVIEALGQHSDDTQDIADEIRGDLESSIGGDVEL